MARTRTHTHKHKYTHTTQFRFSSVMDKILLFIAIICAILHGAAFPIVMLIFGELTDTFIDHAVSAATVNPQNSGLANAVEAIFNLSNISVSLSVNITNGIIDCDAQFNFEDVSTTMHNIISKIYGEGRVCVDNARFTDIIEIQCYIFVGIAVATFITSGLQSLLFEVVAERQIYQIRKKFYQAILRQNIGWFDASPSGELSSHLSE